MSVSFFDYIWVGCIILCNIMYFVRKSVLAKYGYSFSPTDFNLSDGKHLKEIIDNRLTDEKKKKLYTYLNISVGALFGLAVLIAVIVRLIPELAKKWSM